MSEKLRKLILYLLQLTLILVPLTWTTNTSELFEFPKMLLTYTGTVIIAGLWLSRMVLENRFIFKKTPLFLPLMLFLFSQVLSTLFSIDIHTSIFGYYSRFNGGLLSTFAYLTLYFAATSNLTKKDVTPLINTLIFTAILSSLYAFPEHFGHSPSCQIISGQFHAKCWVQDVQNRVFGTFGQPNWLAAYIISIIFLPLGKILNEYRIKNIEYRSIILYSLFAILLFLVLLFTKSRSGLVGFGLGLIIFTILSYKKRFKVLLASYFILLTSFLIFGRNISGTTDKLLNVIYQPAPVAAPTTSDSELVANSLELNITPSSKIRQIVWKGAINLALKYPLFGSGPETFAYSYYNVRPVEHNLVSEWDFLYNKAHNEFLNYAATTGFIGLGTYLFFLISYVIWSFKTHKQTTDPTDRLTLSALVSGFIALSISNFFGFSTVPVQILLFLFPGLAYLLTLADTPAKNSSKLNSSKNILIGLILLTCLVLTSRIYQGYKADKLYAAGKSARQNNNYQTAITDLETAIKKVPNEALYTDELALTASEIAKSLATSDKPAQASEAATIAIELANRTLNLNKVHLNFYKTRAKIFINLSQVNVQYATEAAASLDAAIHLAPTDAKLWLNRALLTEQFGYKQEALKLYQYSLELKPNYDLAKIQIERLEAELATQSATPEQ